MKTLTISLLVFCIVAVSSKQWTYDNKHTWVPGYNFVDEPSLHPKLSSMHERQNKINDQIEDKIVQDKIDKKIEEIVRNEIDDKTEDNIVPSEVKIIPTRIEDLLMSKLGDKL